MYRRTLPYTSIPIKSYIDEIDTIEFGNNKYIVDLLNRNKITQDDIESIINKSYGVYRKHLEKERRERQSNINPHERAMASFTRYIVQQIENLVKKREYDEKEKSEQLTQKIKSAFETVRESKYKKSKPMKTYKKILQNKQKQKNHDDRTRKFTERRRQQ